nr:MAG TPA: hypothetical protein [Caudoviricetes sp.]
MNNKNSLMDNISIRLFFYAPDPCIRCATKNYMHQIAPNALYGRYFYVSVYMILCFKA